MTSVDRPAHIPFDHGLVAMMWARSAGGIRTTAMTTLTRRSNLDQTSSSSAMNAAWKETEALRLAFQQAQTAAGGNPGGARENRERQDSDKQ